MRNVYVGWLPRTLHRAAFLSEGQIAQLASGRNDWQKDLAHRGYPVLGQDILAGRPALSVSHFTGAQEKCGLLPYGRSSGGFAIRRLPAGERLKAERLAREAAETSAAKKAKTKKK